MTCFAPDSPAVENQDRQVQIVAFLDYRCPYCRKLSNIRSKLPSDNIRIVYKEWSILGDSSVLAARAGLATDKQRKYLSFHMRLMKSRLVPTIAYIEEIANELTMNLLHLRLDMNSGRTMLAIGHASALASALGFIGTPALVVRHTIVQDKITQSQLERLIEDERQLLPRNC